MSPHASTCFKPAINDVLIGTLFTHLCRDITSRNATQNTWQVRPGSSGRSWMGATPVSELYQTNIWPNDRTAPVSRQKERHER